MPTGSIFLGITAKILGITPTERNANSFLGITARIRFSFERADTGGARSKFTVCFPFRTPYWAAFYVND